MAWPYFDPRLSSHGVQVEKDNDNNYTTYKVDVGICIITCYGDAKSKAIPELQYQESPFNLSQNTPLSAITSYYFNNAQHTK